MGIIPWHEIRSPECLSQFTKPLMHSPACLSDIHEEMPVDRSYPVETGLFRDLPEFFFCGGELNPGGPAERTPVVKKVWDVFGVYVPWARMIRRHENDYSVSFF
jgi:hypothetical protein